MRIPPKVWKSLGIGIVVLLAIGLIVRAWVVPGLIARQIEARYAGKVKVGGWWLGGSSSGITGLELYEGEGGSREPWAKAEAIETDLTLGGLLSGKTNPGKITLRAPSIVFRLDKDGHPLTKIPLKGGGGGSRGSGALPAVLVEKAVLTISQEGREPMVVTGVDAKLASAADGEHLDAEAKDPTWGDWKVVGKFDSGFQNGEIHLSSAGAQADAKKVRAIPFVPAEVWKNIEPTGPVDVRLDLTVAMASKNPMGFLAEVDLKGTDARIDPLDITATGTTGTIKIDGGHVSVAKVAGMAVGGRVRADGALDFTGPAARFDLALDLDKVDVAKAPARWQLKEDGITSGLLTGKADLKAVLAAGGVDLTGTTGEAVVEGGELQGIPIKSLRLSLKAEGGDLHYEQPKGDAGDKAALRPRTPIHRVSFQKPAAPPAPEEPKVKASVKANEDPKKKAGGFKLPKSITTQIELEDVDLRELAKKAAGMNIHIPVPVAGKLSLKADATIPLGDFKDIKAYVFRGDAKLKGASIDGVDLGNVELRLVLDKGVLDLTDFRGQLVDLPDGGVQGIRPEATAPVPAQGALPPGGFRGHVHAELSPPGKLSAHFEAQALPVGELAAPAFPKPTPVSGLLTFDLDATADLANPTDPKSWDVNGHLKSERIAYLKTTLDALSASFSLKQGHLDVPDLAARLSGKPLSGRLAADLAAPYAFDGRLDVKDWDLSDVLTLVPGAPSPAPVDGLLTARASAKGTLSPRDLRTDGEGKIANFRAGPVPLGDVPFHWKTDGDFILATITEARPFGGKLSASAKVPAKGEGPIRAVIDARGIDTAQMTALMPDEKVKLTGKADGRLDILVPSRPAEGAPQVEANLKLSAPDLTVQGVPAEGVSATISVHRGVVKYEVLADSLGGKIKFKGDIPLGPAPAGAETPAQGNGEFRAIGFNLGGVWKGIGMGDSLAPLDGLAAVDANVRTFAGRSGLYARAVAEVRDLHWGKMPLGHFKGTLAFTPTAWRIDPLGGVLLGGEARGTAWGETPTRGPRRTGFEVAVDRVELEDALALWPAIARHVGGDGNIRLAGRVDDDGVHANGEVNVPRAHVFGLTVTELHLPADLALSAGNSSGSFHARRFRARVAGGKIDGEARFRLGEDRAFDGRLHLSAIDLETLTRIETESKNPASGKVSGTITWSGRDPRRTRGLRGKIDLDLDDASLFQMPVFKELGRVLGAAGAGTFEDGDLHATLGERELSVDQLTLEGRVLQLHISGTVGYNTQLNLEVLVNTAKLIPETGQALARLIPGLSEAGGRRDQAVQRVGGFLSNRLMKFRVTGTIRSPQVNADPAILVGEAAVGFFGSVLKLPLNLVR